MQIIDVEVKKTSLNSKIPTYATIDSSGMDLCALTDGSIEYGKISKIDTGIRIALHKGYEAQIRPRSGLAFKEGIIVVNSPGTIDSDYRGDVCVLLTKVVPGEYHFKAGDKIAQMVICPVVKARLVEVDILPETYRGTGGFGSTGK